MTREHALHALGGRCLTEGFASQGQRSPYRGRPRGEPGAGLPPTAFVGFLQNPDQVGNRVFGERRGVLTSPAALRAARAALLPAPSRPLLFTRQEWAALEPSPFFRDLGPAPVPHRGPGPEWGRRIYSLGPAAPRWEALPPWAVARFPREEER